MAPDLGKLILRASLALMLLPHGINKLVNGIGGIQSMLGDKGIPEFVGWGVIIGEVVAPLFMIIGYRARIAALVFAFNMLAAVLLAHSGDIFALSKGGAWKIELQMLYFFGSLSVALLGAGRYSLSRGRGRWD